MLRLATLRWGATCASVKLADDGLNHLLQLLLLSLEVLQLRLLVRFHPLNFLFHCLLNGFFIFIRQLPTELLLVADLVLQGVGVALQFVAGIDPLLELLVLVGKALCVVHHAFDVLGCQAVLVVGDGDFVLVARALILRGDTQNTVDVDLKGDLDLGYATRGRRDASQVKGAQQVVVFRQGTLT